MTALIGVIGAVVGAVVTQAFNLYLEKKRAQAQATERELDRRHERELRELELAEALEGRLYADRRAAYTEFYGSYLGYRRSLEDASNAWGHVHELVRDRTLGDPDLAQETWTEALHRSTEARLATEQALMLVELAASPPVRDAAAELRQLAWESGKRSLKNAAADFDAVESIELWDAFQDAEKAVRGAEQRLREAIQIELELGRGNRGRRVDQPDSG